MRSRVRQNRLGIAVVCLGLVICVTPGCAVGSKSMSIDSTSKMPWFGLELKGRKPKSDGPAFRSVRNEKGEKPRIDTLGRKKGDSIDSNVPATTSSTALPLTDRNLVSDARKKDAGEIDFH
ncbi:MAG: hypothetical protein WCJ09_01815 [Planctomycetota bacterium]